jgi:hypothetical protein
MGEKVTLKAVYELAEKNKSEDRLTQADVNQAKKTLGYKKPKDKGMSKIKDYDNNMDDLPRGLQIDTTTDSSGSAANKFSTGGDVTVGKGGDYIKDLI